MMCNCCSRFVDFNEFLDIIIESQGDDKDVYEEILQGFTMFDYGKKLSNIFDHYCNFL